MYNDGAMWYVNKEIRYDPLFHHEEPPDYEEAWERPLRGEYPHTSRTAILTRTEYGLPLKIPTSMAADGLLPESVELAFEPGYRMYAVAVHHQCHCLNCIRKSFYPEKFLPNETKLDVDFYKSTLICCDRVGWLVADLSRSLSRCATTKCPL